MTDEQKRAHVKALMVQLETVADKHMGVILRSSVCGVDAMRSAIAMALIESFEMGARWARSDESKG